ncbi:MAG TPA: hypothetical protein VK932_02630 [Kofleriaceae bacterium]|nr:hypothetical protein [Kofleriaceae bacterium]
MLRFALVALLATSACRISLEDDGVAPPPDGGGKQCMPVPANPQCAMAEAMPDVSAKLGWIEQNIFVANCGGTSCHGTGSPFPVLTTGSHAKLVDVDTTLAPGRKLVVPGDVGKSYLMVILRHLNLDQADPPAPAPARNAYMPAGLPPICCEKLDALERWILAGAMND